MVRETFAKLRKIEKMSFVCRNRIYGTAYITYTTADPVSRFYDIFWSTYIEVHFVRAWPLMLNKDKVDARNTHILRISGLPIGMTGYTLRNIFTQSRAQTLVISRNPCNYNLCCIAFLAFKDAQDKERAKQQTNLFLAQGRQNTALFLMELTDKICFRCGDPFHSSKECPSINKSKTLLASQAWKNHIRSYANTAK